MKTFRRLAIALVLGMAILLLSKNMIAKAAVVQGVKAITGLGLSIRDMDVGLFNTKLSIHDLQVLNPAGFHDPTMLAIPEIYLDYDLSALLKGKVHLEEVRLNLQEFTVVKNERGEVNLYSLQAVKASKKPEVSQEKQRPVPPPPPISVDILELNIGKVIYKDYSTGTPRVNTFDVDIHERFHGITNPYALTGLIITRALAKTTVARLTNLDLGALQSEVTNLIRSSLDQTLEGLGKGALGSTKEVVKGTTDTLKKLFGQ